VVGHGGVDARLGRLQLWAEKGGRGPKSREKIFLFLLCITTPKYPILSTKIPFSKGDPKIKVLLNFVTFNFAKRSRLKFLIDFELEI
jgi:hypothetical protein